MEWFFFVVALVGVLLLTTVSATPSYLWARFTRSGRRAEGLARTARGMHIQGVLWALFAVVWVSLAWFSLSHHQSRFSVVEVCLLLVPWRRLPPCGL
jgi:heme/copper-type cytochrome/quinol oxidase subunit 2